MKKAQIGMVGLAVMGENLAMNMESHGFTVAVYDVRPGVVEHFMQGRGAGKGFIGAHSWQELADSLQPPRKVMLMIRAGEPVDQVIAQLLPVLVPGDTIIDGGNSHFPDTIRRTASGNFWRLSSAGRFQRRSLRTRSCFFRMALPSGMWLPAVKLSVPVTAASETWCQRI